MPLPADGTISGFPVPEGHLVCLVKGPPGM
jgi:hypothetical protein